MPEPHGKLRLRAAEGRQYGPATPAVRHPPASTARALQIRGLSVVECFERVRELA